MDKKEINMKKGYKVVTKRTLMSYLDFTLGSVKYKIDNETSFTTFLTHDTDGAISDAAVNIESSGASLPEYKEIQGLCLKVVELIKKIDKLNERK